MKLTYNGQKCDVPEWATEQAYKNGYAKGYADGVKEFAVRVKQTFHSEDVIDTLIRKITDRIAEEMVGADNGE